MIHYYAVEFMSWLIKLLMFQRVSKYRFKKQSILFIPLGIMLTDYFYYDAIFWGEIFILPIVVLFIKNFNN